MKGKILMMEGEVLEVVSEPLMENLQEQGEDILYFVYVIDKDRKVGRVRIDDDRELYQMFDSKDQMELYYAKSEDRE